MKKYSFLTLSAFLLFANASMAADSFLFPSEDGVNKACAAVKVVTQDQLEIDATADLPKACIKAKQLSPLLNEETKSSSGFSFYGAISSAISKCVNFVYSLFG